MCFVYLQRFIEFTYIYIEYKTAPFCSTAKRHFLVDQNCVYVHMSIYRREIIAGPTKTVEHHSNVKL